MDADVRTQAKRFHRAENPSPFELIPRDLTILAHVAKHRFLTSSQIARLDGGANRTCCAACARSLITATWTDRQHSWRICPPPDHGRSYTR